MMVTVTLTYEVSADKFGGKGLEEDRLRQWNVSYVKRSIYLHQDDCIQQQFVDAESFSLIIWTIKSTKTRNSTFRDYPQILCHLNNQKA